MHSLTFVQPDDWHLHLRDGAVLQAVLPETARHFARAIIMPNLVPPVVTAQEAQAYRERITAALPDGAEFTPLMTLICCIHRKSGPQPLNRKSGIPGPYLQCLVEIDIDHYAAEIKQ